MNFLAAPALLLLASLPVLFWLSLADRSPTRKEVGTHFIWRKVAENSESASAKTRWFDLLFWLLILAVVTGAISAARPAIAEASGQRQLAVFVERVFQTGEEPQLEHIANKTQQLAKNADITFYVRGKLPVGALHEVGELQTLQADSATAARSAFIAMSGDADGRLLFVLRNTDTKQRILPRLESPVQAGVVGVDAQDVIIRVRFIGAVPEVSGATIEANSSGSITLKPNAEMVTITSGTQDIELTRNPFGVGVGKAWVTRQHQALFKALRADDGAEPDVWLGSDKQTPGLRIAQGKVFELTGAEVHIDSTNDLFQELPLHQLDWLGEGKLMTAERGIIPLVRVTRDGKVLGDIVRKKGDYIEFAGDPFSHWQIERSVLLLDNAISMLTGNRPSERQGWHMNQPANLVSSQALRPIEVKYNKAEIFKPEVSSWIEYGQWLAILAGLLCLLASGLSIKKQRHA